MENVSTGIEELSADLFAEWDDTNAINDLREGEPCRLPCTASSGQVCQISHCLPIFNEILFKICMQLREQCAGSFSLICLEPSKINLIPPPNGEVHRPNTFLRWLLRNHVCITGLKLIDRRAKWDSHVVLNALTDDTRLKELTLNFYDRDDTVQRDIMTLLPRLRGLEVLKFATLSKSKDALVVGLSELLRTTTCLTALVFFACFEHTQPPKLLIDALAANSTLKYLELHTEWKSAEPPGVLGEYLKCNRLLTSLTLTDLNADLEDLLLDEALVCNKTLRRLQIFKLCGGERTVRFLARILEENTGLRELTIGRVRVKQADIPEATSMRCAHALAENNTLEVLALPYDMWHPKNWISLLSLLERNRGLKKLHVSDVGANDGETFRQILEELRRTKTLAYISFGTYTNTGDDVQTGNFTSLHISGNGSEQVDDLQRLCATDCLTHLTVDVCEADERFLTSLAQYTRKATVLRKLCLVVTSPERPAYAAPVSLWIPLFDSIIANRSLEELGINSSGSFNYNDHLVSTIVRSRSITRVSFVLNVREGVATNFVSLLSEAIGNSYVLLEVDLRGAKVGAEAKRSLFNVMETTRRNSDLVERAASFDRRTRLDWYSANALEKVSRHPALLREVAKRKRMPADEVAYMVRRRLRSIEGLDDFMQLTGVVNESVTCAPPVDGCSKRLEDLNNDCWRLVRRYLSVDDVKRFTFANPDKPTLTRTTKY